MSGTPCLEAALFLAGSAVLVLISRRSLFHPRSHGFYRFLAWEVLLGLFVLNLRTWFSEPLAGHQLVSWVLLILSLFLVIGGVSQLREIGTQDADRNDPTLLGFEKTSRLVNRGLYRYIRHPLYSSLLCLGWGMFFKSPSWPEAGLALLCTGLLVATARSEERENIRYFGEAYVEYMKHSRMFIPFIF